ncbi:MAG: GAF domain-containing SpoIIE family protein phosphatase [Brevinematia bacterium]
MNKKTDKQKNNLSKILEINKKISSYSNLRDILDNILLSARELFNSIGGSLLLVDKSGKYLKFEVVHGDSREKLEGFKIPVNKGIAGYIFTKGVPVISNNTDKDPRFFRQVDKITGLKTQKILGVPLIKDGKTIGVIEIVNKIDNSDFTKEDLDLLSIFAEQAVIAINNAILIKKIEDRAKELEYLYEISNFTISSIQNSKEFFNKAVNLIAKITNASRVSIMMLDEKSNVLKIVSSIGIDHNIASSVTVGLDEILRPSLIVFKEGKHLIVPDVDKDKTFGPNKKLRYKKNSFMIFPIKTHSSIIGVLNITEMEKEVSKIEKEDIELLQLIANEIGSAYESITMYERELEKKALEREIEIMTKIQRDMLPDNFNLNPKLDICFYVQPYRMVGGDFYDIFYISDKKLCFFLGDVSGKGLPASLFMAAVKSTVRALAFELKDPRKILEASSLVLAQPPETSMFSSIFIGVIDLDENSLTFSNAGHGQQFLLRNQNIIPLHTKGIPLGIYEKTNYSQEKIHLMEGDIIVVYSDGIVEAVNEKEEMFGEKRIVEIVKTNHHLTALQIKNSLISTVKKFKVDNINYDDDIAVGVIKVLQL